MNNNDSQKDHNSDSDTKLEGSHLYERIIRLREMLSHISYCLSQSNAAARASSIIKTCISLNAINFDVMNTVVKLMVEVDACNIFPTSKEVRLSQPEINAAKELADDLLADMPFDVQIVDQPKAPVGIINDNYLDDMQDVIIIGTINHVRRITTRRNDLMAVIKVLGSALEDEVVAFPRTFAKYRDVIECQPVNIKRVFICDLNDGQYILKEIKEVEAPVPTAFEKLVDQLFEDETVFEDETDDCSKHFRGGWYITIHDERRMAVPPHEEVDAEKFCPKCRGWLSYPKNFKDWA